MVQRDVKVRCEDRPLFFALLREIQSLLPQHRASFPDRRTPVNPVLSYLLQLFGPIIADIFKKWFENLINDTVADLGPNAKPEETLKLAFMKTKPRFVAKRALLSRMLTTVHLDPAITKLPRAELNELKKLSDALSAI